MLWAIDVGNTHTVLGVWDSGHWIHTWRLTTSSLRTEDEFAVQIAGLCQIASLPFAAEAVVVGSVVPNVELTLARFSEKYFYTAARFLRKGADVGVVVTYNPPEAVGADRLANALAALASYPPPIIVADFGTATTLDTIDGLGHYIGGVIFPGVAISLEALVQRTAKLPSVSFEPPASAIGRTTVESLQSGIVFGYADAIEGLIRRVNRELGGGATVISTGGQGKSFLGLCPSITKHEPHLTLEGLRLALPHLLG